ncbi:MAG TPA: hypothetical protein VH186_35325 [Chloroflexia bacterium]|nr:hypothetical protein [Chloroflexia bacterium]
MECRLRLRQIRPASFLSVGTQIEQHCRLLGSAQSFQESVRRCDHFWRGILGRAGESRSSRRGGHRRGAGTIVAAEVAGALVVQAAVVAPRVVAFWFVVAAAALAALPVVAASRLTVVAVFSPQSARLSSLLLTVAERKLWGGSNF